MFHNCEPEDMHGASTLAVDPGTRCGWAAIIDRAVRCGECSARELIDNVGFTTGPVIIERAMDRVKRTFDPWPHYIVGALVLSSARDRCELFHADKTKVGRKWFKVPRNQRTSRHELDALAILFHRLAVGGPVS